MHYFPFENRTDEVAFTREERRGRERNWSSTFDCPLCVHVCVCVCSFVCTRVVRMVARACVRRVLVICKSDNVFLFFFFFLKLTRRNTVLFPLRTKRDRWNQSEITRRGLAMRASPRSWALFAHASITIETTSVAGPNYILAWLPWQSFDGISIVSVVWIQFCRSFALCLDIRLLYWIATFADGKM